LGWSRAARCQSSATVRAEPGSMWMSAAPTLRDVRERPGATHPLGSASRQARRGPWMAGRGEPSGAARANRRGARGSSSYGGGGRRRHTCQRRLRTGRRCHRRRSCHHRADGSTGPAITSYHSPNVARPPAPFPRALSAAHPSRTIAPRRHLRHGPGQLLGQGEPHVVPAAASSANTWRSSPIWEPIRRSAAGLPLPPTRPPPAPASAPTCAPARRSRAPCPPGPCRSSRRPRGGGRRGPRPGGR